MDAAAEDKVENKKDLKQRLLRLLSFLIPIIILGYIVYLNWSPFGYEKTYIMNITENGEIKTNYNNFYIKDLKDNKLNNLSELYGAVNLVIEPKAIIKNASVNIEITGDNVYIGSYKGVKDWDYEFDFTSGIPGSILGNASYDKDKKCVYFNGNNSLYLPNSKDVFETGPFVVYVEYSPENNNESFQQIAGHYNWELLQDKDQVRFNMGRMNSEGQTLSNLTGKFYSVNRLVQEDFFNEKHSLLATYNPSEKGYITLFVDGKFSGITLINDETIWKDYNREIFISFGKSKHVVATYFVGCLYNFKFKESNLEYVSNYSFNVNKNKILIPVFGNGKLDSVKVKLRELK